MLSMTGVNDPPSATDTLASSEGGATMDLHGVVLTQAFDSLLSGDSRVLVVTSDRRQLSISHPILLLFSPLLRSALGSVKDSSVPTIVLPEVSSATLMQLEDLLTSGKSTFPSLADCRAVLEASSLLGIPISSLVTGDQGPTLKINLGRQPELEANLFHIERRRRKVVLVCEDLMRGEQPTQNQPMETAQTKSREFRRATQPTPALQKSVLVKQEPVAEEEPNHSGRPAVPGEPQVQGSTDNQRAEAESSVGENSAVEEKNKCEKCYKGFPSLTLLRYHYCSHFRGLLKKKYAELFEDNKCLMCQKTFANSGRLLLHIGVQHDKINEILKSKGLCVLPPFMTTVSTPDAAAVSKIEPMESESTKGEPSMPDLSTKTTLSTSLVPAPMVISSSTNISSTITTTSAISTPAVPTISTTPTGPAATSPASPAPPSAPSQGNSQQDSTSCNYDLECEVCSQKQRNIQLLEQHCCRHFMKELQEQYATLMDGLRCTLCNNVFKQKHSLLLHIGCKHGKVNDILKQKGFAALPCPVNATNNAAMQKQLIQIKKERMESVKDEGVEQKGNSTLDAILKKYQFTTGVGNKLKKV